MDKQIHPEPAGKGGTVRDGMGQTNAVATACSGLGNSVFRSQGPHLDHVSIWVGLQRAVVPKLSPAARCCTREVGHCSLIRVLEIEQERSGGVRRGNKLRVEGAWTMIR